MPLGQRFDAQKAIEAILYVAPRVRDPSFHTISKVLYFADKRHLARYGFVITGDDYVAMKHGPVPSRVYDLLKVVRGDRNHGEGPDPTAALAMGGRYRIRPLRDPNLDLLSRADVESLDASIGEYGHLPFDVLADRSHDAAWNAADENDILEIEDIARASGGGATVVDYVRRFKAGGL